MYNRYQGNTGRVERVDDGRGGGRRDRRGPPPAHQQQPPGRPSVFDALEGILPKKLDGIETEDLMLLLILYLMYRESGDKEMLIIMGAMFLM